jgi:hypothetical protein
LDWQDAVVRFLILLLVAGTGLAQTVYSTGSAPFTSYSRTEGASYNPGGIANSTGWAGSDGAIRWRGNHTVVDVTYYAAANFLSRAGSGATICLYVDGAQYGSCVVGAGDAAMHTTASQWVGLSGSHDFLLANLGTQASGGIAPNTWLDIITQVIVTGGTGFGAQPATIPLIIACSDSLSGYQSSLISDTRLGDWWQVSHTLGYAEVHYSEYGAKVTGTLKTDCPNVLANTVAGAAASQYIAWEGASWNDAGAGVALGTAGAGCTTGTFECDLYNWWAAEWAAGATKVYSRSLIPNSYTTSGTSLSPEIATYNAAKLVAVTQWNTDHPSQLVRYYRTTGWCDPVTGTVADHLHPTIACYAAIANREIPIFAGVTGTAWIISGVTTSVGTISLTATLAGGATWMDQVTYTSSNAADTVCLAGTCGTGSATIPASLATTTAALTVSGSPGSRTLTPTALPDAWTPPATTSVTIQAATTTFIPL